MPRRKLDVRALAPETAFAGWTRYAAELRRPDGRDVVTWLVPEEAGPVSEDWLLPSSLAVGMARGLPMRLHGSLSPRLMESVPRLQQAIVAHHPGLTVVDVEATGRTTPSSRTPRRTVGCFSAGLDSYYMALDHRDPVDELFFVKGFEAPASDEAQHFLLLSTVIPASRALERPLHLIETNFLDVVELLVERSPYIGVHITIGAAMLLGSRVGTLRFPSAYDEALPDDVGWRFTDYVEGWSTQSLEIEAHGALERVEKIPRVVAHEPARRHLRVCWATDGRAFNCGRCNKCVRTVLNQELAGCPGVIETLPPHLSARRIAKTPVGRPENALGLQECLREAKRQGRTDVVDALRRCFARGEAPPTVWRRLASRLDRARRRLRYSLGKRRTRRALRRHRRRHGHDHLFLTCKGACDARREVRNRS